MPKGVWARKPIEQRFWEKVDKTSNPDGCWVWLASCGSHGYGQIGSHSTVMLAHKFAYESEVGTVPIGLQLDHLCRNRKCVNPAHLEPVTQQENIRRGQSGAYLAARTHCPRGHEYAGDNLYIRPDGRGRECRACHSQRQAV